MLEPMPSETAGQPAETRMRAATMPERTREAVRGIASNQTAFLVVVLLVMWFAFSRFTPYFLTTRNLLEITVQAAVVAIAAAGQTLVILSAGIDLSIGSVLALASVTAAIVMEQGQPVPVGILVGVLVGGTCGLVNGFAVGKLGIPPFIATLGMMGIARGFALIITQGVAQSALAPGFDVLGQGRVAGLIPVPTLVVAAVYLLIGFVLSRTRFGRYTYALGSNLEATKLAGINVSRYLMLIYAVCGMTVGLAAMVDASRVGSGQPAGGEGLELQTIAAVVIGGTSLFGGQGSIYATVVGALMIASLRNGLNVIGVYAFWQNVIIGVLIMVAVYADQWRRRRAQ